MTLNANQFVRALTASVLVTLCAVPQNLFAQATDHVVSSADLQQATVDASQTRLRNRATLNEFFSSDKAQQAMRSAHINPQQVKAAVASLSDDELAQLASKANNAQSDFAAGTMGQRDLLIILIGIALLILIIVAVR